MKKQQQAIHTVFRIFLIQTIYCISKIQPNVRTFQFLIHSAFVYPQKPWVEKLSYYTTFVSTPRKSFSTHRFLVYIYINVEYITHISHVSHIYIYITYIYISGIINHPFGMSGKSYGSNVINYNKSNEILSLFNKILQVKWSMKIKRSIRDIKPSTNERVRRQRRVPPAPGVPSPATAAAPFHLYMVWCLIVLVVFFEIDYKK